MMSSSRLRTRESGGFSPYTVNLYHYRGNGSLAATYPGTLPVGTHSTMVDTVTSPYQPGKTIVNNGMQRSVITKAASPVTGSQTYLPYSAPGITLINGEQFVDMEAEFDSLIATCSNKDYSSLLNYASTRALAGVKRPEVSGLVAIKELKETIHSLTHPIDGILNWLSRNAPTRRKRRRKSKVVELDRTRKDISDQHLTVIFGILPFIQDIQGILKALREYDPLPQRYTSRGEASSIDTKTSSGSNVVYEDSSSKQTLNTNTTVTRTVTVRAYQLYEASVSIQDSLGLSLSDVPKAAWQALPLSFVADWFLNIGDAISAITPVSGVTYIASGYTVTEVDACDSAYNMQVVRKSPSTGWAGDWQGGTQQRVSLAKRRVPATLLNHIGVTTKSRMDRDLLDTFKITAGLSLINQRLNLLERVR